MAAGFLSFFWWAAAPSDAPAAPVLNTGGWLPEKTRKAYEKLRKKRRDVENEIERTIREAYRRLTGKEQPLPKIDETNLRDKPEQLAIDARRIAEKLAERPNTSARQHANNAAIIADLRRMADEIVEAQRLSLLIEEEAIVTLLLS